MKRGILTVISGFSGAGKGTIVSELVKRHDNYALSISMTTRAPREGEEEGVHYFFVDRAKFESCIAKGRMLEYAKYVDNYYGTPRDYVEDQLKAGKDVILEIEIQGALKVKDIMKDALLLFVMPPSAAELRNRLVGRGTESPEIIDKRMRRAIEEAEGIDDYEYIIINDDLDVAVKETHDIIQSAKYSVGRNRLHVDMIREQLKDMAKGEE